VTEIDQQSLHVSMGIFTGCTIFSSHADAVSQLAPCTGTDMVWLVLYITSDVIPMVHSNVIDMKIVSGPLYIGQLECFRHWNST
jgi:hypothetical protein